MTEYLENFIKYHSLRYIRLLKDALRIISSPKVKHRIDNKKSKKKTKITVDNIENMKFQQ